MVIDQIGPTIATAEAPAPVRLRKFRVTISSMTDSPLTQALRDHVVTSFGGAA